MRLIFLMAASGLLTVACSSTGQPPASDASFTDPFVSFSPPSTSEPEWQTVADPGQQPGSINQEVLVEEMVSAPVESVMDERESLAEHYLQLARQSQEEGDLQGMVAYLREAAIYDSAVAHYELARAHTEGKVVLRDLDAASRHLNAAAGLGNPEAVRVLGWQKLRGDDGIVDRAGGIAMLEQAAQSSVRAQRELGMLYANLYQLRLDDPERGRHYLRLAYEKGDIEAAYGLGRLLFKEGRPLEAVAPLSFAAEYGHSKSTKLLAEIDPAAVAGLQMKAGSEPLDAEALYQRGISLMRTSRENLDLEADAYAMLSLASDQGHELASQELAVLDGVKYRMNKVSADWLELRKVRFAGTRNE